QQHQVERQKTKKKTKIDCHFRDCLLLLLLPSAHHRPDPSRCHCHSHHRSRACAPETFPQCRQTWPSSPCFAPRGTDTRRRPFHRAAAQAWRIAQRPAGVQAAVGVAFYSSSFSRLCHHCQHFPPPPHHPLQRCERKTGEW